jgi:Insertion element 4 transposase N-terminal/Transposase DDE domain
MGFKIREMNAECKFSQALTVEALSRVIPPGTIRDVLQQTTAGQIRERKLTLPVVVWLVIALHLYTTLPISAVLAKLARGLRFLWPDPLIALPTDSALTYRRYQVGARPLARLFHQVCQPIATQATRGAFLFGLRLMALDGTVEDVPDTPANAAVFGRHTADRGASAFPQIQVVYLAECGTHAIVDAGFWPCHTSERVGGFRLLRSLREDMLVLWDRGFHDYDMLVGARQRGAQVLGRLPSHVKPERLRTLPDGSVLAIIRPSDYQRRKRGEHLLVRVITYALTDPALPGSGETYRVLTTLLDPCQAPAYELACAYHERWEIELVVDEVDTHQRLAARTLRSLKPVGVIQELYGLLLAHYAVRVLMHEAALEADLDPDRLSFVHALEVVRDAVPEFQLVAPEQVPLLYARLLLDLAAKRLPERRPRSNPRVVKRKMSNFKLKRAEHLRPPKLQRSFRDAIIIQWEPNTRAVESATTILACSHQEGSCI